MKIIVIVVEVIVITSKKEKMRDVGTLVNVLLKEYNKGDLLHMSEFVYL
jgi:hypothetical protein